MRNLLGERVKDKKEAIMRMNFLRGLFAILIVLGHCSMEFEKELFLLLIIHKFNMVSVCFFFIISGISLTYNYYNKEYYLEGFIKNKVIKLFCIATICGIVERILQSIFVGNKLLISWTLFLGFNWYIYESIIYYIVFCSVYKSIKNKNIRVIILIMISIIVSLFTLYMSNHYDIFWTHAFHYSSLCFVWGIILYEYYDRYEGIIINKKFSSSAIFLMIGSISCICLKMPKGSLVGGVLLHNLIGICVMTVLFIWSHFINYYKIPIIGQLTKYATEIYLYQFGILVIVKNIFVRNGYEINMVYVFAVVIITFILAIIMNFINQKVSKILDNF